MVRIELKVLNRSGLHTRPAASIVKVASKYKCEIELDKDGFVINSKSIIGVMTLAAEQGSILYLITNGIDEKEASDEIAKLFESGFGEI
ncbi:MAG: HPr family phosphocarrier protein [Candidatus Kapabacteria bacterium]|nr:HPr family phosphocarrier protein [Candidatus Kapabacteria bacterium]